MRILGTTSVIMSFNYTSVVIDWYEEEDLDVSIHHFHQHGSLMDSLIFLGMQNDDWSTKANDPYTKIPLTMRKFIKGDRNTIEKKYSIFDNKIYELDNVIETLNTKKKIFFLYDESDITFTPEFSWLEERPIIINHTNFNNIIFYGFSFGVSDRQYIEKLFSRVLSFNEEVESYTPIYRDYSHTHRNEKITIIIYYHSQESKEDIIDSLYLLSKDLYKKLLRVSALKFKEIPTE